jgi:DNA (cytosine-5)-methyltransferase 1
MKLRIGSLFSGVGGLDMALEAFFDAETVWHCEWDDEPSKVLAARWPGVPNHRDVTKVDWATIEPVDIICGGSPCQDISAAGRRAGMVDGTRSNLWVAMREAIAILKPSVVIWENVRGALTAYAYSEMESEPGLLGESFGPDRPALRAAGRVVGDLSDLGYDSQWVTLPAADVGAPHRRERVFVLAYARGLRFERPWPSRGRRLGSADGGQRVAPPVALFPTVKATNNENRSSDWANGPNLGEAIAALLPTPSAGSFNEAEDIDAWLTRRERVKEVANNGNGFGMPLGVAVRLLPTPRAARGASTTETMYALGAKRDDTGDRQGNVLMPTPQVADATGGHATRSGDRREELLLPGLARSFDDQWVADDGTDYGPAVRLWESLTRPVPPPTLPDGKNGNHRLAAVFPEWMMGYPAGHVTDIIARNPAIKACGNGVVPQQAYAAVGALWRQVLEWIEGAVA